MPVKRNKIKVFVASTVYNFQPQLEKIYALLDSYGYDVFNSHKGTFFIDSNKSNLDNCLAAVQEADAFVGIIRPDYGSGVLKEGNLSITHYEFREAMGRNIPRFILADSRVTFARAILDKAMISVDGEPAPIKLDLSKISFKKGAPMDMRCIDMYNEAIQNNQLPHLRIGNWVQEYITDEDLLLHLESQFKNPERIKKLLAKKK